MSSEIEWCLHMKGRHDKVSHTQERMHVAATNSMSTANVDWVGLADELQKQTPHRSHDHRGVG